MGQEGPGNDKGWLDSHNGIGSWGGRPLREILHPGFVRLLRGAVSCIPGPHLGPAVPCLGYDSSGSRAAAGSSRGP